MAITDFVLIVAGAFAAGAVNAVVGGGTFFSFFALLAAGGAPVEANERNSVALWAASGLSALGYRHELFRYRQHLPPLSVVAPLGGALGGYLLLQTKDAVFSRLIPWLLLLATLLFAFSLQISTLLRRLRHHFDTQEVAHTSLARPLDTHPLAPKPMGPGGLLFQLGVSTYGGFFGAGMGILMLASLAIQGIEDVNELNALKNWLSAVIYSVATVTFVLAGAVSWPHTLLMVVAASGGGYVGGSFARKMPAVMVKRVIVLVGFGLTALYFVRSYG